MNISLFGNGKTTQALSSIIDSCTIYDDNITTPTYDKYQHRLCPSSHFDAFKSDLEIISPGIPPTHFLAQQAQNLMSEYDYFAKQMPFSIWISGSNGKTTTTQMAQALFEDKGSIMGGNIGTPLAFLSTHAHLWILETSSFTLHYTSHAAPNIYLLLPIRADHISWHGSFRAYQDAKLKTLTLMNKDSTAIIPHELKGLLTQKHNKPRIFFYHDTKDLMNIFDIDCARIPFQEPFLQDAILALAAYKVLYQQLPYEKLHHFSIGKHRLEEIRDAKNRLWVNDSKATNVDASIQALKRYNKYFIHLIIGGDDKGAELHPLFSFAQQLRLKIYIIGSNYQRLEQLAQQYSIPYKLCKELSNALKSIDAELTSSQVALLSPAASSLDQFSSYEERGMQFCAYAHNIL